MWLAKCLCLLTTTRKLNLMPSLFSFVLFYILQVLISKSVIYYNVLCIIVVVFIQTYFSTHLSVYMLVLFYIVMYVSSSWINYYYYFLLFYHLSAIYKISLLYTYEYNIYYYIYVLIDCPLFSSIYLSIIHQCVLPPMCISIHLSTCVSIKLPVHSYSDTLSKT